MKTPLVNIKHNSKYDVYIGRGSPYGNPFRIGIDGTREQVILKYLKYLKNNPALVNKIKSELPGKTLGCWCKPELCHGEVIIAFIEGNEDVFSKELFQISKSEERAGLHNKHRTDISSTNANSQTPEERKTDDSLIDW